MKKIMLAVTAMAACAAMAEGEITSANVVGYNTITIRPGWNMFSVNFKDPSNENGIALQDLFPGEAMAAKGAQAGSGTGADSIQVYDASNTTDPYEGTYVLWYTSKGTNTKNNYKWVKSGSPTEVKFKNGQAFWYRSRSSETYDVSISGEVELTAEKDITILPGWNMIASPFAANFNPNALGTAYWEALAQSGKAAAGSGSGADSIQIYDSSNTTDPYEGTYVLWYTSKGTNTKNNYKWVKSGVAPEADADFLKPGQGTWYRCRGTGFTLTIPRPYSL